MGIPLASEGYSPYTFVADVLMGVRGTLETPVFWGEGLTAGDALVLSLTARLTPYTPHPGHDIAVLLPPLLPPRP